MSPACVNLLPFRVYPCNVYCAASEWVKPFEIMIVVKARLSVPLPRSGAALRNHIGRLIRRVTRVVCRVRLPKRASLVGFCHLAEDSKARKRLPARASTQKGRRRRGFFLTFLLALFQRATCAGESTVQSANAAHVIRAAPGKAPGHVIMTFRARDLGPRTRARATTPS